MANFSLNDEVILKTPWLKSDELVAGIIVAIKKHKSNPDRKYKVHLVEPWFYSSYPTPPLNVVWCEEKELELFS